MHKPTRRRVYHPGKSPFASPKAVAQQHLKNEADINTIVARAKKGIAPLNARDPGVFADISNVPQDLTEAFARVESAWDLFEQLPARAREELNNDPRKLTRATPEFMLRHGLATLRQESVATPPGSSGGQGAEAPSKASKKPSKGAPAPSPDQDDQE